MAVNKTENKMLMWVVWLVLAVMILGLVKWMAKNKKVDVRTEVKIENTTQLNEARTDLEATDLNQLDVLEKEVQGAAKF